jgi:hypothetical protein
MMYANSFRLITSVFWIALLAFTFPGTLTGQEVETVRKGLEQLVGTGKVEINGDTEKSGNSLKGSATILGVNNVTFEATFGGSALTGVGVTFPASSKIAEDVLKSTAMGLAGGLYLPEPLKQGRLLSSINATFKSGSLDDMTMSFSLLENFPLVDGVDLAISGVKIGVNIKDPLGAKTPSGSLSGMLSWRGNSLTLSSKLTDKPENWELSAEIEKFELNDLVKLFQIDGIELPSFIRIGKTKLTFRPVKANYLKFESQLNDGMNMEIVVQKGTKTTTTAVSPTLSTMTTGSYTATPTNEKVDSITTTTDKWMVLLGVSLNEDFKFKSLSSHLDVIDKMKVSNIGLVVSSLDGQNTTSLAMFKSLGSGSAQIKKGLNIILGLDLSKYHLGKLGALNEVILVDNLIVRGYVESNFNSVGIESFVILNESFNLFERVYFESLGLEASITGAEPQFGITGAVRVRPDNKNELTFKGKITLMPVSASPSIVVDGALVGTWNEPFGLKSLALDNISIGAGLTFPGAQSVSLDNLTLSGGLKMGELYGKSTIFVDVTTPQKSGFQASVERLTWNNLVDAFCYGNVKGELKKLTRVIEELNSSLDHAELYIVPSPITTLAGTSLPMGFKVEAKGEIAGLKGEFLAKLDGSLNNFNGFKAAGKMDPITIRENGITFFSLTGAEGAGNPEFTIDLSKDKVLSALTGGNQADKIIYCTAGITILDISQANTLIDLNTNGYACSINGKVLGVVEGKLNAEIQKFSNPLQNTTVEFEANAKGLEDIKNKVIGRVANKVMKAFPVPSSYRNHLTTNLSSAFGITSIKFNGKLSGMKSGVNANVKFKMSGAEHSVTVNMKAAKAGEFIEDLAEAIFNKTKNELGGMASQGMEIAKAAAQKAEKAAKEAEAEAQKLAGESVKLKNTVSQEVNKAVTDAEKTAKEAAKKLDEVVADIDDKAKEAANRAKNETRERVKQIEREARNIGKFFAGGAKEVAGYAGAGFEWAKKFATDITGKIEKIFDDNNRSRIKSDVPPVWIVHKETGNFVYCVECNEGKTDIMVRPQAGSEAEEWQILPTNDENYMYIVSKADGRNIHMKGDKESNGEILLRKHASEDKFKEKIRLIPAAPNSLYYYFQYKKREFYIAVDASGKLYPTFDRNRAAQFEILRPGNVAHEAQKAEQEAVKAAAEAEAALRKARQHEIDRARENKNLAERKRATVAQEITQKHQKDIDLADKRAKEAEQAAAKARAEANNAVKNLLLVESKLYQVSGKPKVFIIVNGIRRGIPDPETFNSLGLNWNNIQHISQQQLDNIPAGAPLPSLKDGALLQGSGPEVYVMKGSKRSWITSAEVFNKNKYDWKKINKIDDLVLNYIPEGDPLE